MTDASCFARHSHWPAVTKTIAAIEAQGFRVLLAGGCVRDLLMNRVPNDFDLASNATPEQLRSIFPQALEVGREFGVTILPEDGFQLEIATFRKDGPYLDGRRPSTIEFASANEDARRRDFTVNALFYDLSKNEILDFVGGQEDIKKKMIRTVGEPRLRFEEDKLRLLRAVRFAAQLDFEIAGETLKSLEALHETLSVVSKERVHDEMIKLLRSPRRAKGLNHLESTQLLWDIVPNYPKPAQIHLASLMAAPNDTKLEVLLALWLKPLGLPALVKVQLKELKFSSQEIAAVLWLIENETIFADPAHVRLAVKIKALSHPLASSLERFCATQEISSSGQANSKRVDHLNNVRKEYLVDHKNLPKRFIDGADVKALGYLPGPQMGQILDEAFNLQLEKTLKSKQDTLDWIAQTRL